MQYLLLVYTDESLLGGLAPAEFDAHMRDCLVHADEQQARGKLLGFQQLESPATAKAVRIRAGR
ncbi:MAG: YciI family protein, partial [Burkholderiaceae bacterium]|nr:YciI family protein [Burkholderiaceae bacterium]